MYSPSPSRAADILGDTVQSWTAAPCSLMCAVIHPAEAWVIDGALQPFPREELPGVFTLMTVFKVASLRHVPVWYFH